MTERVKVTASVLLRALATLRALRTRLTNAGAETVASLIDLDDVIGELERRSRAVPETGPPLEEREQQVLAFLITYLTAHGYQPSFREIQAQLGVGSTKTVKDVVDALARKGYVAPTQRGARSVRVVGLRLGVVQTILPPPNE